MLPQITGCSSTRFVPTDTVVAEQKPKLDRPPGLSIAGYTTKDGANHPFHGTVTMEGESFVFHPDVSSEELADTTAAARAKREPFRVPRAEVTELNSYHRTHPLLIIGVCAAIAAGVIWLGDSTSGN
ncbi:MAG TPA: hypothetical protein VJS69_04025 [Candidatus Krumholzibacteria bacterium]|nr:hypothetical protein [Candidatus Krumholzibacteria bacterium]